MLWQSRAKRHCLMFKRYSGIQPENGLEFQSENRR